MAEYLLQNAESSIDQADLLARYYTTHNDFLDAAGIQFKLASGELALTLEKRIEYLSRARANASTRVAGFAEVGARNRQSRQELLRSINDHLDIANIQDDILQKLVGDTRWTNEERRKAKIDELNGRIMDLSRVCFQFHHFMRSNANMISCTMSSPIRRATTISVFSSTKLPTIVISPT